MSSRSSSSSSSSSSQHNNIRAAAASSSAVVLQKCYQIVSTTRTICDMLTLSRTMIEYCRARRMYQILSPHYDFVRVLVKSSKKAVCKNLWRVEIHNQNKMLVVSGFIKSLLPFSSPITTLFSIPLSRYGNYKKVVCEAKFVDEGLQVDIQRFDDGDRVGITIALKEEKDQD